MGVHVEQFSIRYDEAPDASVCLLYPETAILEIGDFPPWLVLHEGHRQDVGYTLGVIPDLTKTPHVSHYVSDTCSGVALDTYLLVHGPNVAEEFIVAEDMDRALVVKQNPFPGQPDLAGIAVAVKNKLCIVAINQRRAGSSWHRVFLF